MSSCSASRKSISSSKPGLINDEFEVTDDQTREFLQGYLAKFAGWIDQTLPRAAESGLIQTRLSWKAPPAAGAG